MVQAVNSWIVGAVAAFVLLGGARRVFAAKPGTQLSNEPAMEYARRVVARVWGLYGYGLTVTSGYDGSHMSTSLHYVGLAEDYRTRDVRASDLSRMVSDVRAILGRDYDVVLEADHLHVEYDPR
jgi:hypothetical protein